jgi:hypothetical protein
VTREWESLGNNDLERERICTNLLKLADKWEIEVAKKYAIAFLEKMVLPPSRRLKLAGQFTITHWVEPAVRQIFDKRITALTNFDVADMGCSVYMLLVKTQELLDIETRRTAFVPPEMTKDASYECKNHSSCLRVWPKIWFDRIGRSLLHPDRPIMLKDIHTEVHKDATFQNSDLSEACRFDMIVVVSSIKFAHEHIIPVCANKIVQYYRSL